MAYYIRDDRELPSWRGHGNPIRSQKATMLRDADGTVRFIHAAPTVMHDACVHANVPGVVHDSAAYPDPHERLNASFDARDKWAAPFGPGHALCWSHVYSDSDDAPACYFCGDPVKG